MRVVIGEDEALLRQGLALALRQGVSFSYCRMSSLARGTPGFDPPVFGPPLRRGHERAT